VIEPDERVRTRPRAVLAVVAIAVVIALAAALTSLGADESNGPNEADGTADNASSPSVPRAGQVQELLDDQIIALRAGDHADFMARWVSEGATRDEGERFFSNVAALGMQASSMRFLPGSVSTAAPEIVPVLVGADWDAWQAEVEVTWRIPGFVPGRVTSTVMYVFVVRNRTVKVGGVRAAEGHPSPVWLLDRLTVSSSGSAMAVATSEPAAEALRSDLDTAVADVRGVLPNWRGRLLAILPARQADAESLLGSAPRAQQNVAATTTVAGARPADARTAGVIVASPETFNRLTQTGRHVVITHEAVHVATDDLAMDMPLWVAEGFADYVGVGAVDEPLRLSARLALRRVARQGPPTALPVDAGFSASDARRVETAYEFSRLAWLFMAKEHGRQRLTDFHAYVVRRPHDVERAFTRELGVTQAEFTRDWRRYLAGLVD
jgi:hypothetical protein